MGQVEILAPAGSKESLYAALKLGADAVYAGAPRFGARAFAENLSIEELVRALHYAHLRRKKIYLTVNTLLSDRELEEELFPTIRPLYEAGLDACIVQDLGVLSFLHDNFPDMALHASTQMTLFAGDEAELLKPYGVTRYVPARELSISEIREARKQTDLEIEVFVHGALCYCYSGQCLMSEVIGGRSGNRGMCAGPCRLPYQTMYGGGYIFNTKDICTLLRIPELVDAGIDSFKIEGRMKKPEYSAYTAYVYRKYTTFYEEEGRDAFAALVENKDSALWQDYKKCQDLYNRGGFSEGYLFEKEKSSILYPKKNGHFGTRVGTVQKAGRAFALIRAEEELHPQDVLEFREEDDTSAYEYTAGAAVSRGRDVTVNVKYGSHIFPGQHLYRRKNAALLNEVRHKIEQVQDSYTLSGRFSGRIGESVVFSVFGNGVEAHARGDVLQRAEKRPVSVDEIRKNLCATGNTDYVFSEMEVDIPDQVFLPVGGIRKLRRRAIAEWELAVSKRRSAEKKVCIASAESAGAYDDFGWVAICTEEQLSAVHEMCTGSVLVLVKLFDILPQKWERIVEKIGGLPYAVEFPRILRGRGRGVFEKRWGEYGGIFSKVRPAAILVSSYRGLLYARQFFPDIVRYADENLYAKNRRAKMVWQELGMIPAKSRDYGRIAVMESEGCVPLLLGQCKKETVIDLKGPKGDTFTAVSHCDYGLSTIYTKEPLCRKKKRAPRIDFTWENEEEARKVMREWNL